MHRCYNEALAVSEYYIANEKLNIIASRISTPQVNATQSTATPNFGQLRKLSDCIVSLSVEDSLCAFDDLAFQFARIDGNPLHADSSLFDILVSTIVLAIHDVDVPSDTGRASIPHLVSSIRNSSGITQLRLHLQNALQTLNQKSDGQEYYCHRFEKIRDYILEHYSDPNLDAASIAEYYNMSPSNVTRLFKKYNNTGFLEFVHQTRVEKASKLLQSTDLPISEISALVGYTNAATMNRAFKAHANATPGMIRKQALKL